MRVLNSEYKFVGESDAAKEIMSSIDVAAGNDENVLIIGETGTGKEVAARQIHKKSSRSVYNFVALNCAAIPADLIESELFGHEEGSFTGATRKKIGMVETADRGTLFLDELTVMPLGMQTRLLRYAESGEAMRVGSNMPLSLDTRLIAAVQEPVEDKVREDLLYRLDIERIYLPPLRERKSDIRLIAEFYLGLLNAKYQTRKTFTESAVAALEAHSYPGNVRELENIVRYAFVHSQDSISEKPIIRRFEMRGRTYRK